MIAVLTTADGMAVLWGSAGGLLVGLGIGWFLGRSSRHA